MYGNIEIYAAIGRKPQTTDYDLRTDKIEDVLMVSFIVVIHVIAHRAVISIKSLPYHNRYLPLKQILPLKS